MKTEWSTGREMGRYSPGQQITRGDYVLMLCQAFQLSGQGKAGFWDVPRDSYYAQAVMTAQALALQAAIRTEGSIQDHRLPAGCCGVPDEGNAGGWMEPGQRK